MLQIIQSSDYIEMGAISSLFEYNEICIGENGSIHVKLLRTIRKLLLQNVYWVAG